MPVSRAVFSRPTGHPLQQVYYHEQIINFANTPKIGSLLRRGHRRFFVAVCGGRRDRQDRRQQQLISRR